MPNHSWEVFYLCCGFDPIKLCFDRQPAEALMIMCWWSGRLLQQTVCSGSGRIPAIHQTNALLDGQKEHQPRIWNLTWNSFVTIFLLRLCIILYWRIMDPLGLSGWWHTDYRDYSWSWQDRWANTLDWLIIATIVSFRSLGWDISFIHLWGVMGIIDGILSSGPSKGGGRVVNGILLNTKGLWWWSFNEGKWTHRLSDRVCRVREEIVHFSCSCATNVSEDVFLCHIYLVEALV